MSEEIFHCMELERVPMRDEKADGLSDIATKRDGITNDFVGVDLLGSVFFEEGVFEH